MASQPIKIKVLPIPDEGRPANFSGSVGNYLLSGRLEKNEVAVGEPFTLSLNIEGDGNLDSVAEPKLNFPNWIEVYDTDRQVESGFDETKKKLQGRIRIDYVLIARQEGEVVLNPIEFSYFSPANNRFLTLKQGPFRLKVKPDEGQAVTYLQGKRKRIRVTGEDFRHIHAESSIGIHHEGRLATGSEVFWGAMAGPWVLFAGLLVRRKRIEYLERNPSVARKIQAKGEIRQRLSAAANLVETGGDRFYGELENAIHNHLSAQFITSTRGLTRPQLRELLTGGPQASNSKSPARFRLQEDVADRILALLDRLDGLRYAPVSGEAESRRVLLEDVRSLLGEVRSR